MWTPLKLGVKQSMMRLERGKELPVLDQMDLIEEGRLTNPAMRMIQPPTPNPEAVRLEISEKCLYYGLSREHSELLARAWIVDPANCLEVLPPTVAERFDAALRTCTPMSYL